MTTIFSAAQIEHFKREAKLLCRSNLNLTHSAALDRIAVQYSYPNWSVLHKRSVGNGTSNPSMAPLAAKPPFVFERTWEEMRLALRKLPENRDRYPSRADEALALTEDISGEFTSAENIVDFAVAYISSLLTAPRFHIYSASRASWEMRCWLPYCIHHIDNNGSDSSKNRILLNRNYKPVGQISKEWVEYDTYTNLHLRLGAEEVKELTPYGCSTGYLFGDGACPWHSRQHAEKYLKRLQALQAMLKG